MIFERWGLAAGTVKRFFWVGLGIFSFKEITSFQTQEGPPGINQMTLLHGFVGMDVGLRNWNIITFTNDPAMIYCWHGNRIDKETL